MKIQSFLIKYAEIAVKGKNRYLFEDKLVQQIARRMKKVDGKFDVRKTAGRIYVTALTDYDYDEALDALQHVFGIVGICPMLQIEDHGFEDLSAHVVDWMKEKYGNRPLTFKVAARRARKNYPLDSSEINAKLGEAILDAFPQMKVDVHHPDVLVNIEVREDINIYTEIIKGAGGMPLGTNGRGMLLLSGGIDSPVAGYMISAPGRGTGCGLFPRAALHE